MRLTTIFQYRKAVDAYASSIKAKSPKDRKRHQSEYLRHIDGIVRTTGIDRKQLSKIAKRHAAAVANGVPFIDAKPHVLMYAEEIGAI